MFPEADPATEDTPFADCPICDGDSGEPKAAEDCDRCGERVCCACGYAVTGGRETHWYCDTCEPLDELPK